MITVIKNYGKAVKNNKKKYNKNDNNINSININNTNKRNHEKTVNNNNNKENYNNYDNDNNNIKVSSIKFMSRNPAVPRSAASLAQMEHIQVRRLKKNTPPHPRPSLSIERSVWIYWLRNPSLHAN